MMKLSNVKMYIQLSWLTHIRNLNDKIQVSIGRMTWRNDLSEVL